MPYVPSPILLSFSYLVTGYVLYTSITRLAAVEARALKVAEVAEDDVEEETEAVAAEPLASLCCCCGCCWPLAGGGSPVAAGADAVWEGMLQRSARGSTIAPDKMRIMRCGMTGIEAAARGAKGAPRLSGAQSRVATLLLSGFTTQARFPREAHNLITTLFTSLISAPLSSIVVAGWCAKRLSTTILSRSLRVACYHHVACIVSCYVECALKGAAIVVALAVVDSQHR